MKIPSPDWGKPKLGRCYANALLFVARNEGWALVHGIAICSDGTAEPMGHAWAERSVKIPTPAGDAEIEIVADPYMRKLIPKVLYYRAGQIQLTVRYSSKEAWRLLRKHDHTGPWDDRIAAASHDRDHQKKARKHK